MSCLAREGLNVALDESTPSWSTRFVIEVHGKHTALQNKFRWISSYQERLDIPFAAMHTVETHHQGILMSLKVDVVKQCRLRSDATERGI